MPSDFVIDAPSPTHPWFDTTAWPLVIFALPASPSTQDLRNSLDYLHKICICGKSYAMVVDTSQCQDLSATQRKMITDQMQVDEQAVALRCVALAMVFESALMRGVMTAMSWVNKPACPQKAFRDVQSATFWARQQLLDTGFEDQSASIKRAL